jgi:hypothetical protein
MGNGLVTLIHGRPPASEYKEQREARAAVFAGLKVTQEQMNTLLNNKPSLVTPDAVAQVNQILKDERAWLTKNPNAALEQYYAKSQDIQGQVIEILETDKARLVYRTWVEGVLVLATRNPQLTNEQRKALETLLAEERIWYKESVKTKADSIEYADRFVQAQQKVLDYLGNPELAAQYTQKPPGTMKEAVKAADKSKVQIKEQQEVEDNTFTYSKAASVVYSTASSVVFRLILGLMSIIAAVLAANMAIGRKPAYRVLFFIWAALPLYSWIALLYGLYVRIRYGPFRIYGVLPISVEPASTRLGRLLWWPFVYIPDQEAADARDRWATALGEMVA